MAVRFFFCGKRVLRCRDGTKMCLAIVLVEEFRERRTAWTLSDFFFHREYFPGHLATTAVFESIYGSLLQEKYFCLRDFIIRPWGLVQVPSQLNDNSILTTSFQISLNNCILVLCCYVASFCRIIPRNMR